MPVHMKLYPLLALFLVACRDNRSHDTPPPVVVQRPDTPPAQPQSEEEIWVLDFNPVEGAVGAAEFSDRIVLTPSRFESREGISRGFAAVEYARMGEETFTAVQTSPTDGTRQWSCSGSSSLMCTLTWTHADGRSETYIGDGHPTMGDPFQGEWQITLTPEQGTEPELSGHAMFDRGALDLSVGTKRYEGLVYFVRRPPGAVSFLTTRTTAGLVQWNGWLMNDGIIASWDELPGEGPYSVEGKLTLLSTDGAPTTYHVSSVPAGSAEANSHRSEPLR